MVRFISLSSGSNGNCYYIGQDNCGILIDAGIGSRTIKKRLLTGGISVDDIAAVLVSHDHFDHIRSLGTFTERYHKPSYATAPVIASFERHFCTKGYMSGSTRCVTPGETVHIQTDGKDGFCIDAIPFRVPHDATDTVGYHLSIAGRKVTFITDIGNVTDEAVRYASISDALIVEANYDVDMLINGPYPPELKMRIMDGHGHLSNEQTASLITRALNVPECHLKHIFLCHLSENNNTPSRAYDTIKKAVPEGIALYCLPRREASREFII